MKNSKHELPHLHKGSYEGGKISSLWRTAIEVTTKDHLLYNDPFSSPIRTITSHHLILFLIWKLHYSIWSHIWKRILVYNLDTRCDYIPQLNKLLNLDCFRSHHRMISQTTHPRNDLWKTKKIKYEEVYKRDRSTECTSCLNGCACGLHLPKLSGLSMEKHMRMTSVSG